MRFVLGYIDPSSGSMILQMVVGGTMAVVYGGRRLIAHTAQAVWAKLRGKPAPAKQPAKDTDKPDKRA